MKTIKLTGTDAIQVRRDGDTYTGVAVVDKADNDTKQKAHRDAWQLIPDPENTKENAQFAGAMIDGISITNCKAESDGKLQLIFQSDGGCTNVNFQDNTLDTNGKHFISVVAFSGTIKNNRDSKGNLVPIQLFPLRLGGNSDGKLNVFVLSFKNGIEYAPVSSIVKDETLDHVIDYRFGEGRRKDSIYLHNFDLEGYWNKVQERQLTADEMRSLALKYGTTEAPTIEISNMKMSAGGLQILMNSESVSYDIYLDQAGLPTIGWGHCLTQSEVNSGKIRLTNGQILDIRKGGISPQQAKALLESDLEPREQAVNRLIDVPLEQYQFDALTHFLFNVGEGAVETSTLRKKLNRGMYDAVPSELRKWKYITKNGEKVESKGLINRREVAVALWNNDYQKERGAAQVIEPDYSPMPDHKPVNDEIFEAMLLKFEERFMDKLHRTEVEILNSNQDLSERSTQFQIENVKPNSPIYNQAYQKAKEAVYQDNSKPSYQSKIIGIAMTMAGTYFANKYGWDISPEVKSFLENMIIGVGAAGVIVARQWFTTKILKLK